MKKVLLTGGSGFVGRNVFPFLLEHYDVDAPARNELNLLDMDEVARFVEKGKYDVVLHMASPNPVKSPLHDGSADMLHDSLMIFMNFLRVRNLYGKMIYAGSGAEFDKRLDISFVKEEEIGRSIPIDAYGLGKYIMNEIAIKSDNIYNLRLFAVYGPHDHDTKFITHAINCCLKNEPISIRQDCMFDYLHVNDVVQFVTFLIDGKPKHLDYNCCSGERYKLSEIAAEVCKQMGSEKGVELLSPGWNKEYTGSCERFLGENSQELTFISLQKGVEMQIAFMKGMQ